MKKIMLAGLLIFFMLTGRAQYNAADTLRNSALKVYFDCYCSCDMEYFQKKITFINYVREVKEADLYILITSKANASRGYEYTFFFTGQKRYAFMTDTLKASSSANNTSEEIRGMMVRTLKMGLVRYVARTPLAGKMNIALDTNVNRDDGKPVEDKWKSWVFNMNGNLYFSGQKSYKNFDLSGSFYATRITPEWKIRFNLYCDYHEQNFKVDESTLNVYSRSYSFYHMLVRSLSDHWSAGGTCYISHSTYSNLKMQAWLTPGIEYNIFPYSQSTRRHFYLFYKIGPEYNYYIDTTIFNKTKELLFFHRFALSYGVIQKWGSISVSLNASNYLHDFSKYNVSLYSAMSFRIFKGFSFNIYGQYALIHDQLALPKEGATDEEILLRQKELSTQFSYYLSAGLSYTFGSIYNNVVNPRFLE